MGFEMQSLACLEDALRTLEAGFQGLPAFETAVDTAELKQVLQEVAEKMRDNYPYHHPLYAGQMLKPPHPIARLAYMLAMWLNPNNHALDGGRASSAMEKEAVANLARMFGWETHLGHLCGGGTLANLEALWIAGRLHPGKLIVASQQAHYTHQRISDALGLPFQAIPCDQRAKMDLKALTDVLKTGQVGTIVVTLGTTATGSIDPLPAILPLAAQYGARIHVDAAYGGYFVLAANLAADAQQAFQALGQVASIVVDPHKHGLQPYGCGCVLFQDPSVGRFYQHDSPYTYFSSAELHLGEISLECSRAGAAAVALWATQRMLPLTRDGKFAEGLSQSRQAALTLFARLQADARWLTAFAPELDIVVFAPRATSASAVSRLSRAVFEAAAAQNLHLAVAKFPQALFERDWDLAWDQDQVVCVRSCLMKSEHLSWLDEIWRMLNQALEAVSK